MGRVAWWGCSPWGPKVSNMTECLSIHTFNRTCTWNCIREKVSFRLTGKVLKEQQRRHSYSPWDLRVGDVDGIAVK